MHRSPRQLIRALTPPPPSADHGPLEGPILPVNGGNRSAQHHPPTGTPSPTSRSGNGSWSLPRQPRPARQALGEPSPQGESAGGAPTNGGPGACRNHRIGARPGRRAPDTLAERGAHPHLTGSARRPHRCSTPQAPTPAAQSPTPPPGPGGQSLTVAHRADPADRVLATDISRPSCATSTRPPRESPPADPTTRGRTPRRSTRGIRRRDLPPRTDVPARPAARTRRHASGAAAPWPRRRHRLIPTPRLGPITRQATRVPRNHIGDLEQSQPALDQRAPNGAAHPCRGDSLSRATPSYGGLLAWGRLLHGGVVLVGLPRRGQAAPGRASAEPTPTRCSIGSLAHPAVCRGLSLGGEDTPWLCPRQPACRPAASDHRARAA